MNKIIALDIGKVCLGFEPIALLQTIGSDLNDVTEKLLELSIRFKRGQVDEVEWLKRMRELVPAGTTDEKIYKAWNSILKDTIPGMAELVQELYDAGYKIIFFSDTNSVHMREVYCKLEFANLASGSILSFEVGAKKPAAAMYEAFESKYGVPCLYIDDRIDNIKAAQARNWPAHRFTDAIDLRKTLLKANIL